MVDAFLKINHALEFDYDLDAFRVIKILENGFDFEGAPKIITVNKGAEFICLSLDKWAVQKGLNCISVDLGNQQTMYLSKVLMEKDELNF